MSQKKTARTPDPRKLAKQLEAVPTPPKLSDDDARNITNERIIRDWATRAGALSFLLPARDDSPSAAELARRLVAHRRLYLQATLDHFLVPAAAYGLDDGSRDFERLVSAVEAEHRTLNPNQWKDLSTKERESMRRTMSAEAGFLIGLEVGRQTEVRR